MTATQSWLKTTIDRAAAACLLVTLAPLLTVAAIAVKLASPGPALFRQQRIGLGGRPFTIYKFRTMDLDAERHALGSVTVQDDPRVFPFGRWLRRTKIDELPQLFNVFGGTMSLVGPRPTVEDDHQRMTDRQRDRTVVKPGVTGLAQIRCGASRPWPERIEYDLYYVENYRASLDVRILLETCWTIFRRADWNPPVSDEWDNQESTHPRQAA